MNRLRLGWELQGEDPRYGKCERATDAGMSQAVWRRYLTITRMRVILIPLPLKRHHAAEKVA